MKKTIQSARVMGNAGFRLHPWKFARPPARLRSATTQTFQNPLIREYTLNLIKLNDYSLIEGFGKSWETHWFSGWFGPAFGGLAQTRGLRPGGP